MSLYSRLAATATALLTKYGAPAVLERPVAGEYDTTAGEVDDNGTQLYNTRAARSYFEHSQVNGTSILAGDAKFIVDPTIATAPKPDDVLVFDGERYKVVNCKPEKPASVVLYYDVQARRA
jgi:hypothetical protein